MSNVAELFPGTFKWNPRTAHIQSRYVHDGDGIISQFRSILVNLDGTIDEPNPEWITTCRITNYGNALDGENVLDDPNPTLMERFIKWLI